jgi:hypothetical protein
VDQNISIVEKAKPSRHPQNTSMAATMWSYLNDAREEFEMIKALREEGEAEWVVDDCKKNMRRAIKVARRMRGAW